jgi:hypothetical protein
VPISISKKWSMAMKTSMMKLAAALGLAGALALGVTTASFAAPPHGSACIPQYDSSGAQTAPYC